MSVRFVHAADVHLGSPLRTVGAQSPELREQLQDATYAAFERIIDLAVDEDVDFVVVAGDLYDRESRSVRANEFVVEQFGRLADATIPAYVCYGNHDPVDRASEYFALPENVHEFAADEAEEVVYERDGSPAARVWGQSYRSRSDDRKMPYHYTPADDSLPTVGVVHTGLDPDGRRYVPCSEADLRSKEAIHYWALGHVHRPQLRGADPPVVYPGIPQGRQVTEPGVGGCVLVDLDASGEAGLEFVPTSPIVWRTVPVDVGGEASGDGDRGGHGGEGSPGDEGGHGDGGDGDPPETVPDLEDRLVEALYAQTVDLDRVAADLPFDVRDDGWEPEGLVCRWELTGRGPIRDLVEDDPDVLEVVTGTLRDEADRPQPFVWTEAVRDRTRRPLPAVADVRSDDEVLAEFDATLEEVREDRERLRAVAGDVWVEPDDAEDADPTELRLTDDVLDELLDRAEALAVDELLARRYG